MKTVDATNTFNLDDFVRESVKGLKPYSSARDEYVSDGTSMIFLDANENPYENGVNRCRSILVWVFIRALMTTLLFVLTSYLFGVYVEKFARYNELYGALGGLLILMVFIWLNSNILLLGFELNATLNSLKKKHEKQQSA